METKQFTCRLGCAEDILSDIFNEDIDEFEEPVNADNCKIIAYRYKIIIPALQLYIREGVMLMKDEESDEYQADFSLSLIYPINSGEYVYWEQDPPLPALHNFLYHIDKSCPNEADLKCIVEVHV